MVIYSKTVVYFFNNTYSILHKAPESVPTANAERKSGNKKVACKILNQHKF